ncbi:VCBS repeat-containing protein [Pseudenhygromyxa sp. WMMC2535]|uniref:FG-GAP-like repeat-containing protein n=1 Tax=Pseudenhygromyxa sp. WMMC2535 TaxID=2712867 RepID=UPI0015517F08|nr:FG-GAP-like repeat-containing protein [Pseudenhygromyxa sp. WMMC2535]NVB41987.1 VCBS repeat-containing protein [Pseudenhygromyxa sp. WMMC2535]
MRKLAPALLLPLLACPQPGEDGGADTDATGTEDGSGSSTGGDTDSSSDTGSDATEGGSDTDSDTGDPPAGLSALGFAWVPTGISAEWVGFGDFDGDGIDDVFAKTLGGPGRTHLGDGTGSFEAVADVELGWPADFMRAGDFDGDGDLDVAVFDEYSNDDFQVTLNDGAGAFGEPLIIPIEGFFGFGVIPLHANDDELHDLFIPQGHSEGALLAVATGAGEFSEALTLMGAGCYFSATAVADVDGDGLDDVAGTGSCNAVPDFLPLTIYRHVGEGGALDVAQSLWGELGPVLEGADVVFADVDADGDLDLLTPTTLGVYVIRDTGGGTFADPPEVLAHTYADYPRRLEVLELGSPGALAFVLGAEPYDSDPSAALLTPNEDLSALSTELLDDPGRIVGSGDFDGDGRPDLAVMHGSLPGELGLWLSGG